MNRRPHTDLIAVALLIGLWLLFFWRLFTPVQADQASLKQGDFSGQFVAFAGYQYARFAAGEIPLWNPYNNGGLPFIADTQAAVFYPPRLLTIALARLSGGWSYHALELEMTAHVLLYTLLMYLFVRRLTRGQPGTHAAALTAAIIGGYGGFMTGYPPLQLALLEAAIWLPLAALGVHLATELQPPAPPRIQGGEYSQTPLSFSPSPFRRGRWGVRALPLLLTGFALGLSWMAGHPQTSFLLTYLLIAYFAYRVYVRRLPLIDFVIGVAIFGLIAFGLAAVQLLPGFEYLGLTTRAGFGYDAKGNGFPFQDVIQFIFPGIVSLWSPLYVGFMGLVLALIAAWRRVSEARFWAGVALVALLWSFGANGVLYPLLYNILPGLRYFRGQERAAYLVANSLAILAALGVVYLARRDILGDYAAALRIRLNLNRVFTACLALGALLFVVWLGNPQGYGNIISPVAFAVLMVAAAFLLIPWLMASERRPIHLWLIPILIAFELFTFNMDSPGTYDPRPPTEQLSTAPPPLVARALTDTDVPFRVDGVRGLTANYGSLYGLADIRGISPLFLNGAYNLIEGDVPDPVTWELWGVRYVYSDWQELPIPSEIIDTGTDAYGTVNLHQLSDPRPFALLMYSGASIGGDEQAYEILRDPGFNPRRTALVQAENLPSSDRAPIATPATEFEPEHFTVQIDTPEPAILSVALPYYPGWQARTSGGDALPILRAYGGLSAVVVEPGQYTVEFVYNPLSYRLGALVSVIMWAGLGIIGVIIALTQRRRQASLAQGKAQT
jgi:hypothetical protein